MASKPSKRAAAGDEAAAKGTPALDKIASLLALIATHAMEKEAAALKLDAIGFTSHEISVLLDVSENFVRVARHRKKGRKQ